MMKERFYSFFSKRILVMSFLWTLTIISLLLWWIYNFQKVQQGELIIDEKFVTMIRWEGITFIFFLIVLQYFFFFFVVRDMRRQTSLSNFFSSLTHELRTPLANIKLQTEVLKEYTLDSDQKELVAKTTPLTNRLELAVFRMEQELDNVLYLARLYRDSNFKKEKRELYSDLIKIKDESESVSLKIVGIKDQHYWVQSNQILLKVILRNLISNTIKHSGVKSPQGVINISHQDGKVHLRYSDNGKPFNDDLQKITQLFYSKGHKKGSGIGLYLVSELCEKLDVAFSIEETPSLEFLFIFHPWEEIQ